MTASEVQAEIDKARTQGEGGVVRFPPLGDVDFGDSPLRLYSRLDVRFDHIRNTRIKSKAPFAITICGEGGNSYVWRTRLSGCTIQGAKGGIGFDPATADNESSYTELEDIEVFASNGIGVDLRHPHGQLNYNVGINNVLAQTAAGQSAFVIPARIADIRRIRAQASGTDVRKTQGGVVLNGSSIALTACWIEGTWNGPALSGTGQLDFRGTHIESIGGTKFDAAQITVDDTQAWYVQPKQPCILNSSILNVAGIAGWTDNGGGRQTTIEKCYLLSGNSKLVAGEKVLLATGQVN